MSGMAWITLISVIGCGLIVGYIYLRHSGAEQMRLMERETRERMDDISSGRYREPARVRIVP